MTATIPTLDKLKPNPNWAKLPLFNRKNWSRVRFDDVVENLNETCDPAEAGLDRVIAMEHLGARLTAHRGVGQCRGRHDVHTPMLAGAGAFRQTPGVSAQGGGGGVRRGGVRRHLCARAQE